MANRKLARRDRFINGVKYARFSTVYDAKTRTVVPGYDVYFDAQFLRDAEIFCVTALWHDNLFKKRTKAKSYEDFLKHIYIRYMPKEKQQQKMGAGVWSCIAVK